MQRMKPRDMLSPAKLGSLRERKKKKSHALTFRVDKAELKIDCPQQGQDLSWSSRHSTRTLFTFDGSESQILSRGELLYGSGVSPSLGCYVLFDD